VSLVVGFGLARWRREGGGLAAAFAALLLLCAGRVDANPVGGQVVGGQATIVATAPNTLTIDQTTPKAAIDWQSFNIAPNETTQFVQPSASAIALNRVQAGDPSVIAGRLTANGQLILINPNGIVFTKGSQVDVNSLLATPAGISTANFMAGNMVFDQPGNPNAQVINNGRITVGQAGLAALVAPGVANNGVIAAKLGRVVLGGAATYTLDFYGDGLIQFDVGSPVTAAPIGRDGKPVASLVSNAGTIDAPGGTVLLTADAVSGILQHVVDVPGTIDARSLSTPAGNVTIGNVTIDAGAGNNAQLGGRINVSGLRPGQTGGNATVTGGSVDLTSTARIDARGASGGGRVAVRASGGPYGGQSMTPPAGGGVTIAAGATIDASATQSGNGGNVAVLSDTTTVFAGTILANGGPNGGNGGTVETSATLLLDVAASSASVSAAAPNGKPGSWLLDPDSDILITNTGTESATCTSGGSCSPNGDSSILYASTIEAALNAGTSVTVTTSNPAGSQQGSITVGQTAGGTDGAIALTAAQTVSLTLLAGAGGGNGSITLNSPITDVGSGGALSLALNSANGAITVNNAVTLAGNLSASAATTLNINAPIAITAGGAVALTSGGNLNFTLGQGSLQFTGGAAASASLTINGAGYTLLYDLGNDATGLPSMNGLSGNFALAAPVDATSAGTFSGPAVRSFGGHFNGLGNTIANLTINDSAPFSDVGLFGELGGTIANIGVVAGTVAGSGPSEIGALVGFNTGTITNAYATGAVSGIGNLSTVGALVGFNQGTVTNAYATAAVSGGMTSTLGGLVGENSGAATNSYATGTVTGGINSTVGGLVGAGGTVTNSYATGTVTGGMNSTVGGLVGDSGTITNSYATGAVSGGETSFLGGLVGENNGTVTNSYATGTVTGGMNSFVGGLVGLNNGGTVTNSYATGAASGDAGSLVGGLVGFNSGTITNGFWDATTTGAAAGVGHGPDTTTSVTTAGLALASALTALNSSGTAWGNVNNQTTPYLLSNIGPVFLGSDSSATPLSYNLIFTIAQIEAINNNLTGNFLLAQSLDLSSVANWTPLAESTAYTGTFNGLGNTIANLTINDGNDGAVGLFGQLGSGGTISNIGLVGGVVNGGGFASIGALVGTNLGTISNAYATDTVSGGQFASIGGLVGQNAGGAITNSFATGSVTSNGNDFTGGLVGYNNGGRITDAYATGAVSGSNGYEGGLVGFNINSTITDAYATGAVNGGGGSGAVGGLVGQNNGSAITDAYATGAVSGSSLLGGLVGQTTNSGTVTDGYYDTDTTGVRSDGGTAVGMTTAALQAALPTFANGVWSIVAGVSYPYLTNFYPTAPQVISGIAYQDAGVTPLASTVAGPAYVSAQVAGASLGAVTTGANGYYYFLEPSGTIASGGSAVIAYTTGAASGAQVTNASGSLTGFTIWGNTLIAPTAAMAYSVATATPLQTQDAALIASAVGSNGTLATLVAGLGNYGYVGTGASFTIDEPISQNAGLYIQTTAANAPITVAQPVEIDGANGLALNAAGDLDIAAPVAITGAGAVALTSGGNLNFTPTLGSLQFAAAEGSGQTLTINGAGYTLLYDLGNDPTGLPSMNGSLGNFALATPIDATNAGTFTDPVVGTFSGIFNGLGNTISNLTISSSDPEVGLFGTLNAYRVSFHLYGSLVTNLGLVGGTVTGSGATDVGALAGSIFSGDVFSPFPGGIRNVYATGAVSGDGSTVGGLVGLSYGNVYNSYATGAVTGNAYSVGGLVGDSEAGNIVNSHATGAVGGNSAYAGGLTGLSGAIIDSYATGAVSGSGQAGGLVGVNMNSITNAYATGAVTLLGTGSFAGGLVGVNVSGPPVDATITNGYYDAGTTGQPLGLQGDGSVGMTTAALQAALPTFSNPANWGIVAGVSYPYLVNFYPTAPQVISGIAYKDAGVTPLASTGAGAAYVSAQVAGASLGAVTTGANGYYYFLEPAGTISSGGSAVIAYTTADVPSGAANGAAVTNATGSVTGFTIWGNTLIAPTSQTAYSGVLSDISTYGGLQNTPENAALISSAVGANGTLATLVAGLGNYGYVGTGASFTIDEPISQNAGLYVQTTAANAPITVGQPVEIDGANGLALNAAGDLDIAAPVAITGAGAVALQSGGNLNITMGQGSLQFTGGSTAGASLAINGAAYTLLYDLNNDATGLPSMNGLSGNFALATPIDASGAGTLTGPVVGTFSGNFNGLGNTISNLTISDNIDSAVGLFGVVGSGGTVSNIGLVGGSVTGAASAATIGELVGTNRGVIANAYATGTVAGGSGSTIDGGLVGSNESTGTITQAYATGAVNGGDNNAGGLVGQNIEGVISASYATGAVTGGSNASVGGLVGYNFVGTITTSYATGAVSGGTGASVGGLAGTNFSGTIANGFWDSTTTGAAAGVGSGTDTTVPVTTAGLASMLTLTALNGNGIVWGNFNNQTTPYLLTNPGPVVLGSDSSATPLSYNLVFSAAQLEAIGSNLAGNFVLAQPLDLSSVANWTPLAEGTPYTGTFNGLGNAITGLTINDSTDTYVGLFGQLGTGGTITNVSISGTVTANVAGAQVGAVVGFNNGGSISNVTSTATVSDGGSAVGGLVGVNAGAIASSAAVGAVTGGDGDNVGGLVGENQAGGSITTSYALGAVSGGSGANVGGLVGQNDAGATISLSFAAGPVSSSGTATPQLGGLVGSNAGAITDAYAVGSVTGSDPSSIAGGLVGANTGGITDAYATGAVSGGTMGGLTGTSSVTVTAGYYDAGTTGQGSGPQSDGSVGLATGDLQGATLPSGFSASNWGIVAGTSYPYLCWEVGSCANTPQVVAGTVFVDNGQTPIGSGFAVSGLVDGTALGSIQTGGAVFTGANGYYYYLLAPNTIATGQNVLTLTTALGSSNGAALADQVAAPGNVSGLDIYLATLHEITSQIANSTVQADLVTALGSDPTANSIVPFIPSLQIDASGGLFVVDTAITYPFGSVTLNSNGGIIEPNPGAVITTGGLAINAAASVDLPQTNRVLLLAANVTGFGSSFDFVNGQTLFIGTVGSLSGVTTNGTDGSEANIVLETSAGNINIQEPISTNGANGPVLGASLGQIGLMSAGRITESGFDASLVGFAVEAVATNTISLDGSASFFGNRIGGNDDFFGVAQTAGTFVGQVTGAGNTTRNTLTFVDQNASLIITTTGTGGVAAGSLTLPPVSGVISNGGLITLVSNQVTPDTPTTLTLNLPVNANNGAALLGSSPGIVGLFSVAGGDITQGANGIITAGQLFAESDQGNVILTAANHVGANDNGSGIAGTPGLLAGLAGGDFKFVNHDAGIQVDTVGGFVGIFTDFGNIDLATTGAGAIVVNTPVNAGTAINIAVAPGYGFTNNASDNFLFDFNNGLFSTAGLDTSFAGAPIVILADQMSLSAGTINAGSGTVILGPASTSGVNIALGAAGGAGTLGLQQADLDSIAAGALQIGYRNPDATASFTGNIDVAGPVQINTDILPQLELVTSGAVTESGGAITFTGATPLQLGVLAGSATMTQNNAVGTLAAYTDGAIPSFSFVNDNQALTVGTLSSVQFGVQSDSNGFPTPSVMSGSPANPLSGITTGNGAITVTATGSGGLMINTPVNAGTGSVTAASVGDLTIGAGGSVAGGAVTLATLGNFANSAGSGAISAGSGGQWLVYSTNPANDNDGGLTPAFIQYAATYPVGTPGTPTAPDASGNGLLYSIAPQVTVNSVTKVYDGTTSLPSGVAAYTFGGGINGDSVTLDPSAATGAYASKDVASGIAVTLTGVTVAASNGGIPVYGYGVVAASGGAIGAITPATLTAGLTGTVGKVYDGIATATLAPTNYTLPGVVSGDSVSLNDTTSGTYASANVGSGIGVSVTGLALSGPSAGNYMLASNSASANIGSITAAPLTATLIGHPTKIYDGTVAATLASANFSLGGFVSGEGASVTQTAGTYASANAGSGIAVTASLGASNFTANGGTLLSNYALPTSAAGTGTITPVSLTATLIGNPTKTYDGTVAATLASANFSLGGFVSGESASVTQTAGTYASANAGSGIAVTASLGASNFTANGETLLSNYTLPTSVSGTGTIAPAMLTATLVGNPTKTYDGTVAATLASANFSLGGFVSGEGASVTQPAGTYANANAGSGIAVTASLGAANFTANGGTLLSNYTLPASAAGTGTITPAILTAGLSGTVGKIYDGTNAATLAAGNYTLSGVLGGDSVSLNDPISGTYASANAGTGIGVNVSGLALSGSSAGNYVLASGSASANIGTITPAALTATIVGTPAKIYDGTAAASLASANFGLGGFVLGEGASVTQPAGTYASANVGSGIAVTASLGTSNFTANGGTLLSNYTLPTSAAGTGTITPATLTASLTGTASKVYDGTTVATVAPGNYILAGAVSGDNVSLNDPTSGTYASANVGSGIGVSVSGLALTGASAGNYALATGSASANIGTITPAALTATLVGNPTKTYNGAATATLTSTNFGLGGFISGQGASVTQPAGTYASANAGSGIAVTASLGASNFTANGGTLLSNYTLPTSASGTGTITPATLTASLTGSVSKTYDGTNAATLTNTNYTLSGVLGSDSVSLNDPTSGAYGSRNVGGGIGVSVTSLALSGSDAGNYMLASNSASANIGTIMPATLTATIIGNPTKTYDGTVAASLASANFGLGGFVSGEGASVTQTAGTYANANAGSGIAVTASLGASNFTANGGTLLSNYTLPTSASGTGTITPATLTAALTGSVSKVYDGTTTATLALANYTLSGVISGDSVSLNDPSSGTYAAKNVGAGIGVDVTGLALSGTSAGNYVLASASASANIGTITPATLSAGLTGSVSKTYDGTTVATLAPANYALSGVFGGDNVSLNDPSSGTYATPHTGTGIGVSVMGLALSGADAGNYTLASGSASANIGAITAPMLGGTPLVIQPQAVGENETLFLQPFLLVNQSLILFTDASDGQ